jgi:hypothetical protein
MDIDSLLFFSMLLVLAQYLIFLSNPALKIRQQYHELVDEAPASLGEQPLSHVNLVG